MGLNVSAGYIGAGGFQNDIRTDRLLLEHVAMGRQGVPYASHLVVTPTVGAHSVTISAGRAFVKGKNTPASQGSYFVWSDDNDVVALAAPSASPRIDTVILRVADPQYGTVTGTVGARYEVIQGTPAASPTAVADATIDALGVPGGWIRLADVRVNTVDTGAIPIGQFTDKRPIIGSGGILVGDAANGDYVSQYRHNLSNGRLEVWNGSAWVTANTKQPVVLSIRGVNTHGTTGEFAVAHGMGVAPSAYAIAPIIGSNTAVNAAIPIYYVVSADATNVTMRAYRADTNALLLGNPANLDLTCYWP